jgi:hypothetical protein
MSVCDKPRTKRVTEAQICRYVKWAKAAGIDVGAVEIDPHGSVKIIAKAEPKADIDEALQPNDWD